MRFSLLGRIIVAGVCSCLVSSCSGGENGVAPFEPAPPVPPAELFGQVLFKTDGSEVGVETIENTSIIAIYFGAQWCQSCAAFTPLLIEVYEDLLQAGKSFEVVLVSLDNSEEDMFAHMREYDMPWLALPFGSAKVEALSIRYNVQFIPTLIVIDSDGNTVSLGGRGDVSQKGSLAYDDWLAESGG